MERRSFIAILVALFVAPFVRFFERFKTPQVKGYLIRGTDEYVDFGKVADFDPNEPFSFSCWFESKAPKDRSYLFESKQPGKISETTLLDGVTDEQLHIFKARHLDDGKWHHVVCDYDGSSKEPEVFIDGRRQGDPPLPPGAKVYWEGSPKHVAGDDTLSQVQPLLSARDGVEPTTGSPPAVG